MGGPGPGAVLAIGAAWEPAPRAAEASSGYGETSGASGRAGGRTPLGHLRAGVLWVSGLGGIPSQPGSRRRRGRGGSDASAFAASRGGGRPVFLCRDDAVAAGAPPPAAEGQRGALGTAPQLLLAAEVLEGLRLREGGFALPRTPGTEGLPLRQDAAFALRGVRIRVSSVPVAAAGGRGQGSEGGGPGADGVVLQPVFLSFAHLRAFTLCLREALGRGVGGARHDERERRASEAVAGAMEICGVTFGGGSGRTGTEAGATGGAAGPLGGSGAGTVWGGTTSRGGRARTRSTPPRRTSSSGSSATSRDLSERALAVAPQARWAFSTR